MSFTVKQLEDEMLKIPELANLETNIVLQHRTWSEESYPIAFKSVGDEKYVTVRHEDTEGGEDQGSYCCLIFSTGYGDNKRFFRKEGTYTSYDGMDFDYSSPMTEVEKKEVTVSQWVEKSE